jgi:hypothetical protein
MNISGHENQSILASDTKAAECRAKELIQYSATFVAVITVLFYYFGRTYYLGYLSYWGLPENLFALSKEQSIISGIVAYIIFAANVMIVKTMVIISMLTIALYFVMLSSIKPINTVLSKTGAYATNSISSAANKLLTVTPTHEIIINCIGVIVGTISIPILLIFIFVYSSKWVSDQGNANARKEYEEILAGKPSKKLMLSKVTLIIRNDTKRFEEFSGYLIQTSATHCALYNLNKGVIVFPISNITRLILHENENYTKVFH